MLWRYILSAVVAYLLGSISSGVIVARLTGHADPRTVGSKSSGATNSFRTMGPKLGITVFICDALKAIAACLAGQLICGWNAPAFPPYGRMIGAFFVIVGHIWPCFFHFRGGKGVACIIASMTLCFPVPTLICIALGVTVLAVTRIVSLGSITGCSLYAILAVFWFSQGNWLVIAWACALVLLVIYCHRTNIRRLMNGTENRFGKKK